MLLDLGKECRTVSPAWIQRACWLERDDKGKLEHLHGGVCPTGSWLGAESNVQ